MSRFDHNLTIFPVTYNIVDALLWLDLLHQNSGSELGSGALDRAINFERERLLRVRRRLKAGENEDDNRG